MLDNFCHRLEVSGYPVKIAEKVVCNGIICYERKVKKSKEMKEMFHRPENFGKVERRMGKLMGRSNWFRPKQRVVCEGREGDATKNYERGLLSNCCNPYTGSRLVNKGSEPPCDKGKEEEKRPTKPKVQTKISEWAMKKHYTANIIQPHTQPQDSSEGNLLLPLTHPPTQPLERNISHYTANPRNRRVLWVS